jgi:hypothetical protein
MKKLTLAFLTLYWILSAGAQNTSTGQSASNLPVVHDLTYRVDSRTYHRIQQGITWEDISPIDLPALRNSEKTEQVRMFLDDQGYPVTEVRNVSHQNTYPAWYQVPALTRIHASGVTMQMTAGSPSADDAFIPHEEDDLSDIEEDRTRTQTQGYLPGVTYPYPSGEDWASWASLAQQVDWSADGSQVTLTFDARSESWDNANLVLRSVAPQAAGDGFIRVAKYYQPMEEGGLPFLKAVVIERDLMLEGGICGREITVEHYSDYRYPNGDDRGPQGGLRQSALEAQPELQFRLYPNPLRDDLINLELDPAFVGVPVTVEVRNIQGQALFAAQLSFASTRETIRLSGSQYTAGLYFLHINNDQNRISQPFFISK